jgi:uncharacterized protein (DUF1501 family)
MFSRRCFIKIGSVAVGSMALRPFGLLPALAQSGPDYRALVCVFLYGGNDSNNTVIPMDNFAAYTSIRGSLALPTSELTAPITSASGEPIAFHGKLPEVASLFTSKELAVVANVGPLVQPLTQSQYQNQQASIPLNLFSHSDQQIAWQTSVAQGHSPTGWAGRAADYLAQSGANAPSTFPAFFSVSGNALEGNGVSTQPVALAPGQSLQLAGFNNSAVSQARLSALTTLAGDGSSISLVQAADDTLSHSMADASALSAALAKSTPFKTQFPPTSIAAQLEQVAHIIQVQSYLGMRRQIFFCSLGGFDTHAGELEAHNTLYPQLSAALSAFYDATQELGMAQNVTTFTESDFSRTFQPTTTDGSDHAWGSHHLVLGGAVQGGQIFGTFPAFTLGGPNDADTRGRWIPTISIDQYGATLCSWFGIPSSAMAAVFPNLANFATANLGFLG